MKAVKKFMFSVSGRTMILCSLDVSKLDKSLSFQVRAIPQGLYSKSMFFSVVVFYVFALKFKFLLNR